MYPRTSCRSWPESRSVLLATKKILPTCSRISRRNSSSTFVSGVSTLVTKITASHSGRNRRVVAVLAPIAEPTPGVSTNSNPRRRKGKGASTHAVFTRLQFPGLPFSVTNSTKRSTAISSGNRTAGGRRSMSNRSLGPNLKMVIAEVNGRIPTGNNSRPMMAFISELFPRLNCPKTASVKRSSASLAMRSSHCLKRLSLPRCL